MSCFDKQHIGKLGEEIASNFLKTRGYSILEKNLSTPFGEIDLISKKDNILVFFEVKTRRSERFGPVLSAITEKKKGNIIRNCLYYIKRYNLSDQLCRIDAIGIKLNANGKLEVLRHVKNAIEVGNIHKRRPPC
ncbi:MAG: YraN family protein [Candidatus Omnitrophica bacterium]|nr:YraN family protein [Candidatus Omnitrophota bacterium]